MTPQQRAAANATDRLFDLLPPQDVGDPYAFIAAVARVFVSYPAEIMDKAVIEIAQRTDRPTLRFVRETLDALYEPIARQAARERAAQRVIEPPRVKRTPDEQRRIDEQVARVRRQLGIPEGGLSR